MFFLRFLVFFFFSSRRRHTRSLCYWSSDVCSSDLSVETPLHALLPARFVAHTHDVATLSLTDTPDAEENVRRVFGREVASLEYVPPGFPLAKRLEIGRASCRERGEIAVGAGGVENT